VSPFPSWRRAGYAWPDLLLLAFCCGLILVGVRGFVTPSPTIAEALGIVVVAYNISTIVAGGSALLGVVTHARRLEMVGLVIAAGLAVLYGSLILAVAGPQADQTGLLILAYSFCCGSLAGCRKQRGLSMRDVNRIDELSQEQP
jgi:asparagine N-glycosylation enzyme membrane subunit Stt3